MEGCPHRRWLRTSEGGPQEMAALPWRWSSLMAYSMLPLWPYGSFHKTYQVSQVIRPHSYPPIWGSDGGLPCKVARDLCGSATVSVDVEITDGLFHAFFVDMGQLSKDLPSLSCHQNHSHPPIWGSNRELLTQVAQDL